jgi:hypothetical protein
MSKLFLLPRGNLGNQMLQLIYAISLQDQVPDLEIFGYDMPLWALSNLAPMGWPPLTPSLRLRQTDGTGLAPLFLSGTLRRAKVRDIPLRCTQFSPPSRFHDVFPINPHSKPVTGPNELLINVRGAEILRSTHSDYGPIPVGWYCKLIAETGLSPVFLGQLGEDYYSDLLRRSFPNARFVASQGALADFDAIRLAEHIALSVSTFSWLAAWLSQAKTIHLPMLGIFNPVQRPDIWMLPTQDARYYLHRFPIRRWAATSAQISELEAHSLTRVISRHELITLAADNDASRWALRTKALRRVQVCSVLSRL